MELLYIWMNKSKYECIMQQGFNFSPLHRFKVDNLSNPREISYQRGETINLLQSSNGGGIINNITAIVGTNGTGKSTLLSYIANNDCLPKWNKRNGCEKYKINDYEHNKSIYVFLEHDRFIVYHNLEEELTCNFDVLPEDIFWNKPIKEENKQIKDRAEQLWNVRKQLIIYLSNSSFVPETLLTYSKRDRTYNVNLHQRTMYLVANRFYISLFETNTNINSVNEDADGFAWVIKKQRNDRTLQELLDVQYYCFLLEHKIKNFAGKIKGKISVYFENIIGLIEKEYYDDFEVIRKSEKDYSKFSGQEPSAICKKFYEKIELFKKQYNVDDIEKGQRKNCTVVLYVNLLFEAFVYDDFSLPIIDFNENISKQIEDVDLHKKYKKYLKDIKEIDKVLSVYNINKNLIDNADDLASYEKVVYIDNTDFYKYMGNIVKERKSFALRYIRIKNLEMSSGERAMQNMFSWLVLIPQLDEIMGIERGTYESKLLLMDEIDLYCHPEWQRKIIKQLISTINQLEKKVPVQIVVTSHSPLILSDFPRENVIYMNKRNGKTIIDDASKHKQSFGANVYTLLNDSFFLGNGAVGEFAKEKVLDVYNQLEHNELLDQGKQSEYEKIINLIGDDIIRKEIQRLYSKKYSSALQPIINKVPYDINELEKLKEQLEKSLSTINKMIKGD